MLEIVPYRLGSAKRNLVEPVDVCECAGHSGWQHPRSLCDARRANVRHTAPRRPPMATTYRPGTPRRFSPEGVPMDAKRFDAVSKTLATSLSRRSALRQGGAGTPAHGAVWRPCRWSSDMTRSNIRSRSPSAPPTSGPPMSGSAMPRRRASKTTTTTAGSPPGAQRRTGSTASPRRAQARTTTSALGKPTSAPRPTTAPPPSSR